jgi:uroporphyrinogen-III decarboxylase
MFAEFIFPAYKKIYGFLKSQGVEVIVHHSDSYAATLIPHMIDVGIDVFQGCLDTNDIPALIEQYGGQMTFMGGINNGVVDVPNWTQELISNYVEKMCRGCGNKFYIPCCTAGGPASSYPGVYDTVTKEIDKMSTVMFK